MRRNATLTISAALALLAAPAWAQPSDKPAPEKPAAPPEKPITQKDVGAVDVATTPITDLNIKKDEIPQVLLTAQAKPYDTADLGRCSQIAAAVGELDTVLGEDIDLPQTEGKRFSPGRVAQSVVGSFFIPFRGVVREISGANAQQRQVQVAIQAGIARRSFLKGLGQAKGCRYPARSVKPEVWAEHVRAAEALAASDAAKKETPASSSE